MRRRIFLILATAWAALPVAAQDPAPAPAPAQAPAEPAADVARLGDPEPAVRGAARTALYLAGLRDRAAALALAEAWATGATGKAVPVPEVAEFTAARRRMREAFDLLIDLFPGLAFNPPESIKPDILRRYVQSAPGRAQATGFPDQVRIVLAAGGQMLPAALRAAAAYGGPEAEPAIARWLDKGGADDRIAACDAAARLGVPGLRPRAEAILREGLAGGPSPALRLRIARALRQLGLLDGRPSLLAILRAGTDAERLAAAAELACHPIDAVAAAVGPWLADPDPAVAARAAGILIACGKGEEAEAWLARALGEAGHPAAADAAKVALSLEEGLPEAMRLQLLDLQIAEAERRGVQYLRDRQQGDGGWESIIAAVPARGVTALGLLALRKSGVPTGDEAVVRALSALRAPDEPASPGGMVPRAYEQYVWAVEIMAFAAMESPAFRDQISARVERLVALQQNGAWDYYGEGDGGTGPRGGDTSISQVVLLGLREAAVAGVPSPPAVWRNSLTWFRKTQLKDGGWICEPLWTKHHHGHAHLVSATGMTAAGVACLLICQEQLGKSIAAKEAAEIEAAVDRGCARLGMLFSARPDSRTAGLHTWYHLYYLYGCERAGTLAKRTSFAGREWYPEGAAYLLAAQYPDGGWGPQPDTPGLREADRSAPMETAFALLFLRRATRPILTFGRKGGEGKPAPPPKPDGAPPADPPPGAK